MDLKRDQKLRPSKFKNFIKKTIFMLIFLCIFGVGVWALYTYVPTIHDTMDRIIGFANPLIEKHGWLPVLGGAALLFGGIWAFIDDYSEKEERKKRMKEFL
ncbi:hypothetical protein CDO73_26195 [Saccharibacillus sp. O23]|uniref:hypothetical protein n=1 Tax=Saccharibacillus sp. O23 TaxID=2009338 RepID=UPI000B4E0DCB|nr:hypothetical protein [Saccharibacillus sp. O23]OWR25672.1 hypothetical protein CDO73_26195 [Saccharibacillus sp. O23]